jgi:diguanylate cyclase (GGDEF)-like protein/PAS domain S-box-containing protein
MDKKKTILILDDDDGTARLEQIHLEMAGYHTLITHTPEKAEALLAVEDVDLLLLDYKLSYNINGLDFYRKLKAGGINLPVILVTGFTDEPLIVSALREGVADFVSKSEEFLIYLPEAVHRVFAHVETKRLLAESEATLSGIIGFALDGILSVDAQGIVTMFNQAAAVLFGRTAQEVIGKPVIEILPLWRETDRTSPLVQLRDIRKEERPDSRSTVTETTAVRRDETEGKFFPVEASVSRIEVGRKWFYNVILRDITERKRNESLLKEMALHDPLTGLSTRVLLFDRLHQALVLGSRNKTRVGVLFLDIDRFKQINDSLGHATGDMLLKTLSTRLIRYLRRDNTVSRVGGDEFVVVVSNFGDVQNIAKIASHVIESISKPIQLHDRELVITTSVGIALFPDDASDPGTLLEKADTAMYRAKKEGRNNFQFYTEEMQVQGQKQLDMENAIRDALSRKEFCLYHQPQVTTQTLRPFGVEALLRWKRPGGNFLLPNEFIPMAEEIGLICPIGEWVLGTALKQQAAWRESGCPPIRISVNISPLQFMQSGFVQKISQLCDQAGVDPSALAIEITEDTIMENVEMARTSLTRLKEIGVHLSVDHFGKGRFSLASLKRFPIDTLKMDSVFVKDIVTDKADAAVASSIVSMAHLLGMQVIAQGVERNDQRQALLSIGCDAIQGYIVASPLPPEEVAAFIQNMEASRT